MVIGWPYAREPFSYVWGHFGGIWAHVGLIWPLVGQFQPPGAHFWPFLAVVWSPTGATQELGVQTHSDRVALCKGTFFLGLASFWGHLGCFGLFWDHFGLMGSNFWPFLAIMWPPTGATRELGAETWWVGAP